MQNAIDYRHLGIKKIMVTTSEDVPRQHDGNIDILLQILYIICLMCLFMGNIKPDDEIHGCAQLDVTMLIPYPEFEIYIMYYEPPESILCLCLKNGSKAKQKVSHKKEESQNTEIMQTDDKTLKNVRRPPVEPHNEISRLNFQFHHFSIT